MYSRRAGCRPWSAPGRWPRRCPTTARWWWNWPEEEWTLSDWTDDTGVVTLPSGARVRGRRIGETPTAPADFTLVLAPGPAPPWPHRKVNWPDFWVPTSRRDALDALREALRRAHAGERVEAACKGGRGRTGTALAALAILDGLPAKDAVGWIRAHYSERAVEMPWQAWWPRLVR